MARPKSAVPDSDLYQKGRPASQALELRNTEWGKILLLREESGHLISCYLEKDSLEKSLTLACSVVSKPSHRVIELIVRRAYELGLDDPSRQVDDAESLLRRTWMSTLFEEWLKLIDANKWMTSEDLEAILMETVLVTPIMDS